MEGDGLKTSSKVCIGIYDGLECALDRLMIESHVGGDWTCHSESLFMSTKEALRCIHLHYDKVFDGLQVKVEVVEEQLQKNKKRRVFS